MYLCRCVMLGKSPLSQEHLYFYYSSCYHRSDIIKKNIFFVLILIGKDFMNLGGLILIRTNENLSTYNILVPNYDFYLPDVASNNSRDYHLPHFFGLKKYSTQLFEYCTAFGHLPVQTCKKVYKLMLSPVTSSHWQLSNMPPARF